MQISLNACLNPPPGLQQEQLHFSSTSVTGRQGPKSLGGASKPRVKTAKASSVEARVGDVSVGAPEASPVFHDKSRMDAKTHGNSAESGRLQVRKRAFRRAQRRALQSQQGGTYYRGRWMTLASLQARGQRAQAPHVLQASSRDHPRRSRTSGARIQVATINVGGFDTTTFDIFQTWLNSECVHDIVCVQEIHFGLGKTSQEWTSGNWHVVTSVASKRHAGVAFFIRATKWPVEHLRFREIVPGRLLQVRLQQDQHHIDLLGVYQFVRANVQTDGDSSLAQRASIWKALGDCINGLPARNAVIMLGDFNCSLRPNSGTAGSSVYQSATKHADQDEFQTILRQCRLCALNTWSGTAEAQITCKAPGFSSHIDFIVVRTLHADRLARAATPDANVNFSPWRSGTVHHLVQASLPIFPGWRRPQATIKPKFDREALRLSVKRNDGTCIQLCNRFSATLSRQPSLDPEAANSVLLSLCQELYPANSPKQCLRPWQQPRVAEGVASLMDLRHKIRRLPLNAALICVPGYVELPKPARKHLTRQIFSAFVHSLKLLRLTRELRQRGKQARADKLHDLMSQMESASLANDFYALYHCIRQIAPKQVRRRVQIRSSEGKILGPAAEHESIVKHYTVLFAPHAPFRNPAAPQLVVDITADKLLRKFINIKSTISVPPGCAPAAAWKAVKDEASVWLSNCMRKRLCESNADVPRIWSDCWLSLVPKPHKRTQQPGDLRPLGIQEITGKVAISAIKDLLFEQVKDTILRFPQYAYTRGRGTDAAISLIAAHCRRVRASIKGKRLSIHERKEGMLGTPHFGGCQLKLDMSTAFDRLPRLLLYRSLLWAGASTPLAHAIIEWHNRCQYHVQHGGRKSSIPLIRGIRQGCCLAPLLWSVYSSYLLHLLSEKLPSLDLQSCVTMFADDTHARWEFSSKADVHLMFRVVQAIFEVFECSGMLVHADKSEFIYSSADAGIQRMFASRTQCKKSQLYIDLGSVGRPCLVKLGQSFVYLGITASYGSFELSTLNMRIAAAESNRNRLKGVLHNSRYLSVKRRLVIYNACVRSSMVYGLLAVGITRPMLELLQRTCIRHVRAVAKAPRHLTFESSSALLSRLRQPSPLTFLQSLLCTMQNKQPIEALAESLRISRETLDAGAATQALVPLQVSDAIPCPTCGVYFDSVSSMRLHHARKHKVSLRATGTTAGPDEAARSNQNLQLHLHAKAGLPICKHCGKVYKRWSTFRSHLLNTCPVLNLGAYQPPTSSSGRTDLQPVSSSPGAGDAALPQGDCSAVQLATSMTADCPPPKPANESALPYMTHPTHEPDPDLPVSQWSSVVDAWTSDWKLALRVPGVKDKLQHHCIFCNAWCVSDKGGVKQHLRRAHATAWRHKDAVESHCNSSGLCRFSPCEACGAKLKPNSLSTHPGRCGVLFAIRLAYEVWKDNRSNGGLGGAASGRRVEGIRTLHERPDPVGGEHCADRSSSKNAQVRTEQGLRKRGQALHATAIEANPIQAGRRPGLTRHPRALQVDGTPIVETGGCHQNAAVGHILRHVATTEPTGGCPGRHGGDPETLEGTAASGAGDGPASPCPLDELVGGVEAKTLPRRDDRGATSGVHQDGLPVKKRRGQPKLAIFAMECRKQEARPRLDAATADHPGGTSDSHATTPAKRSSSDHAVPPHSAHHIGDEGTNPDTADLGFKPGSQRAVVTWSVDQVEQQCLHPSSGHDVPTREAQAISTGHTHRRHAGGNGPREPVLTQQLILKAKLGNSSNYCYTNSIALCLEWCRLFLPASLYGRTVDCALEAAFRSKQPFHIWNLLAWRTLCRTWEHPSRQHDAAEFLSFLQRTTQMQYCSVTWQSRRNVGESTQVLDGGDGSSLFLPVPLSHNVAVQSLVDDWHSQADVHALLTAPPCLVLQIGRFSRQGVHKDPHPIAHSPTCSVPIFSLGTGVTFSRYQLRSCVVHLGDSTDSGHYRSALYDAHNSVFFYTNDGQSAVKATKAQQREISTNTYLLFYTLM